MSGHPTQTRTDLEQVARAVLLVGALCIVAIGLGGGSIGLLVGFLDPASDVLITTTFSSAFLVLGVGLGLALAWHAWQSMQGRASGPFCPQRVWPWIPLFLGAVFVGQLILSWAPIAPLAFPLFHIAAAVLPSLIVVVIVGRSLGGVARWREVVLQIGSGAFLSTFLAFMLEFAIAFGLVLIVLSVVAVRPGGLEMIQTLADRLQDPTWLQDPADLAPLAASPAVVVIALLVFAGLVPLVEESVKTVGVGLLVYRRPILARAFLWGVANGAGFALAEGLFNATTALDAWAFVVTLRVGATILHCCTGGLMGLAWYYAMVERRWLSGMGLYACSVGLHGVWNLLAASVTLVSLAALEGEVGMGVVAILVLLFLLALGVVVGLVGLTRYVQQRSAIVRPNECGLMSPSTELSPTESVASRDLELAD